MKLTGIIILSCVLAISGGRAWAQESTPPDDAPLASAGMTINDVAAIIEEKAFSAEISGDDELTAQAWGYEFDVFGYHCNMEKKCTEFLFVTSFDRSDGVPMEKINEWNSTEIAGRASLDQDGRPFLDHIVSVSGPEDAGAFFEGLLLWLSALQDFEDFLEQNEAAA